MKKLIILFILLTYLLVSCSSQEVPKSNEDIEREKRKGYSELKVYACKYKSGKIDKDSKELVKEDTYDNEGNVLTRTFKSEFFYGEYSFNNYKYNSVNLPIKITEHYSNGEKFRHQIIKYNKNNIVVEKIIEHVENELPYDKRIYKYDNNGNEISYLYFDKDKLMEESTTINKYSTKNKLIQTTKVYTSIIHTDGKIDTIIITYEYDKNGNIINEKDRKGNIITNYKYNNKGFLIESPPFYYATLSGELSRDSRDYTNITGRYSYNNKGLIIEQKNIPKTYEGKRSTIRYSYNDKNLLKEMTFYDENEKPVGAIIYEYK
jgi:YD repeat-containing protein